MESSLAIRQSRKEHKLYLAMLSHQKAGSLLREIAEDFRVPLDQVKRLLYYERWGY